MANLKKLGERVKLLRKENGLTQERLAELANIDPKTVIDIENARRKNPTLKTLNKIAKVLNTTSANLLSS